MENEPLYLIPDILLAENIFLTIGRKNILEGVTIRADKGKITGLLGRNGAGKTTMLQSIFGTGKAQECDVFLNGARIKKPYSFDCLMNYLPQKPFLPKNLTPKEIAGQFRIDPHSVLLHFGEFEPYLNKKIAGLPGGLEWLYSVLMILLADTRFSLLDEPFTHIMPLHIDQLKTLIAKQKEKKGIVITDHMYRPLLNICDQLYLMKEGKSLLINDRDDLLLHGYMSSITA